MNAEDARTISKDWKDTNDFLKRMLLSWRCGVINERIKLAAKRNKTYACIRLNLSGGKELYKQLKHIYEELGYSVGILTQVGDYYRMFISWDDRMKEEYVCPNCGERNKIIFYSEYSESTMPMYEINCKCGRSFRDSKLDVVINRYLTTTMFGSPRILPH